MVLPVPIDTENNLSVPGEYRSLTPEGVNLSLFRPFYLVLVMFMANICNCLLLPFLYVFLLFSPMVHVLSQLLFFTDSPHLVLSEPLQLTHWLIFYQVFHIMYSFAYFYYSLVSFIQISSLHSI